MRDYDKFKCGRIRVTLFRRALDLAGLGLTPGEVALLEERLAWGLGTGCGSGRDWVPDVAAEGTGYQMWQQKGLGTRCVAVGTGY